MRNDPVTEFENKIAAFFGAPYSVAVDSCTHGIELCLRHIKANHVSCPKRTYLSVPMLANKLGLSLDWRDHEWKDFYYVNRYFNPTYQKGIYDAAVYWKPNGFIPDTFMCLSFQYQKHLSLGRGGMILCPDKESALQLKRLSYDGREPGIPWREQDIKHFGLHYYMTPETAALGLQKLDDAIRTPPRIWSVNDWPDLTQMTVFKTK